MNDNEIIELYYNRSENAISETANKYGRYCKKISFDILRNEEDVEECLNDTYLRTWNSIPPQKPNCLATYIGKIIRNLSIDKFKMYSASKRGNGQVDLALAELEDCISSVAGVEQAVEENILTELINTFLHSKSREKRNIFIRRYWYIHSIKEIATAYNMSESKITSILFRMRNELKNYLEKEGITL